MSDNFENNSNEYTSQHQNVIPPKKDKKPKRTGLIALIIVVALVALLTVLQLIVGFAAGDAKQKHKKNQNIPRSGGKYVAELYIDGTIQEENDTYNQAWLLETIDELKKDNNNLGILLVIDSPGGTVYESDEAYLKLMDYRAEKPVWAYFEHLAASGGYYIGCSSEKIAANRNTLTGSIGVISGRSLDLTGLMNEHGIKMTTITAGKNKNMFNIDSPVSPEQKAIMQSIADECYEQFVQIVSDSRNMSVDKVKVLADGRIYTANQAKNNGLIDEVCSYDDFKNSYKEFLRNEKVSFRELKYEREKKFYEDLFKSKSNLKNQSVEEKVVNKLISSDVTYPAFIYQAE
ncbi:MAG: signal peptide peptidase SppA [Treponemataceae bacterium]|nr:signal peptide peptidase SppA [Treponemataceae bacterium]